MDEQVVHSDLDKDPCTDPSDPSKAPVDPALVPTPTEVDKSEGIHEVDGQGRPVVDEDTRVNRRNLTESEVEANNEAEHLHAEHVAKLKSQQESDHADHLNTLDHLRGLEIDDHTRRMEEIGTYQTPDRVGNRERAPEVGPVH
jgi:IMP dehydrogenase/GMP reductase